MNHRKCAHCGANMYKKWAWVKAKDGRVLCRACGLAQWTFTSDGQLRQNTPEWFEQFGYKVKREWQSDFNLMICEG